MYWTVWIQYEFKWDDLYVFLISHFLQLHPFPSPNDIWCRFHSFPGSFRDPDNAVFWWWKRRVGNTGLKHNIQKSKIMAYSPITSWQIDGDKMETVIDCIFLGSKITMDGDYSHKIKRCLLLGRKAMTNLPSILKSRHITLPTKVHAIKVMFFFPVIMYKCENWTIKKTEWWRIDAFKLWW